jgi:hypothetical protein
VCRVLQTGTLAFLWTYLNQSSILFHSPDEPYANLCYITEKTRNQPLFEPISVLFQSPDEPTFTQTCGISLRRLEHQPLSEPVLCPISVYRWNIIYTNLCYITEKTRTPACVWTSPLSYCNPQMNHHLLIYNYTSLYYIIEKTGTPAFVWTSPLSYFNPQMNHHLPIYTYIIQACVISLKRLEHQPCAWTSPLLYFNSQINHHLPI